MWGKRMERLIGTRVDVHLKCDEMISGVMFDADDKHVYVQSDVKVFVAIPRENIKYYIGTSMNSMMGSLVKSVQPAKQPEPSQQDFITVGVDGTEVAHIEVPQDLDITTCNEQVLKLIWGNPRVHDALRGKIQKSLEYDVGYANISTIGPDSSEPQPKPVSNSFSMGVGGSVPTITPFDIARNKGATK
jgi:hypothetical protein